MALSERHRAPMPEVRQCSVEDVCREFWDVLVIGAGPAGSTVARELATRGHRVLIVDRQQFPREKVCGDALTPDALAVLRRGGLIDDVRELGHAVESLRVFSPSQIEAEVPAHFLTLPRQELDALLIRAAISAGAVFCRAGVDALERESSGSVVGKTAESGGDLRARVGVVATGANVKLLDQLGLVHRRRYSGVAARCYVHSTCPIDQLVFSFERSTLPGYRWIFPLGQSCYNVGCIAFVSGRASRVPNVAEMFDRFVSEFPIARDLLEQGSLTSPLRGASVRCGLSGVALDGQGPILGIGESIGTTFPVSGEGVGKAMESAELAAEVIDAALRETSSCCLKSFAPRMEAGMGRRFRSYASIERWMRRPWLNDLVLRRVSKSRLLRQAFSRIIDDGQDARSVFSWRAMWQSLWT